MKKKFFLGAMFVAAMFATCNVFTSCTDYDDDIKALRQELIDSNATLEQALATQVNALKQEIADLKTKQEECASKCQAKHSELLSKIEELQAAIDALKEAQKKYDDQSSAIASLKADVASQTAEIATLKSEYNDLQTQYSELSTAVGLVQTELSKIDIRLSTIEESLGTQQASIEDLTQKYLILSQSISDANNALAELTTVVGDNTTKIGELENLMAGWTDDLKEVSENAASAYSKAVAAYALAKQDSIDIALLKNTVSEQGDSIKNNAAAITLIYGEIEDLDKAIKEVTTNTDKAIKELETAVNKKLETLQGKVDDASKLAGEAKELAQKANNTAVDALAATITNAKDIADNADSIVVLQQRIREFTEWQKNVNMKLEYFFDNVGQLSTKFYTKAEVDSMILDLKDSLAAQKKYLIDNYATNKTLDESLKKLHTTVSGEVTNLDNKLSGQISDLASKFADYYTKVEINDTLKNYYTIKEVNDKVSLMNTKFSDYYTKAEMDLTIGQINQRIQNVEDNLANNYYTKLEVYNKGEVYTQTEINNILNDYYKNTEVYTKGEINDTLGNYYTEGEIDGKLTEYYTKTDVDNLLKAYETAVLRDELQDSIKSVNKKLKTINEALDALQTSVSNFDSYLKKQITGILIQGTYNPVIGSFSLPTNTSSSVLLAYYGKSVKDAPNWPVCDDGLTGAEKTLVGLTGSFPVYSGDPLLSDDESAYAGNVYLTINPSNGFDFTGAEFTLVNSKDEESAVKLSPIKACDKELTFGWTRGGASNGFYEAEAFVDMDDVDDANIKNYIDVESLKSTAKSAINKLRAVINAKSLSAGESISIADTYKSIESVLNTSLPALGVKSWWEWKDKDNQAQTSSVYSQYSLAAATYQPFSFDFLKDYDTPKLPTISHQEFEFEFNVDMPTFNPITTPDVSVSVYQIVAKIDGAQVVLGVYTSESEANTFMNDWNTTGKHATDPSRYSEAEVKQTSYSAQGLSDFVNQINNNIITKANTDFAKLKDDINQQVKDEINKVTNKLNSKIIDRVNKVINKVNSILSNANHYLQPIMLYQNTTTDKWALLSNSMWVPTAIKGVGGVVLEPTSYTAELIAPAFKKYVAVTDVIKSDFTASAKNGDGDCKSKLQKANADSEGLNQIYSGRTDRALYLPATGYIYEITYVALDYTGHSVATKYYVKAI